MRTTIGSIGERGLLTRLRANFPELSRIGDDSAVLSSLECPVISTDSFFEGTHFHRWWAPPHVLGRRLIEAALSDLAAMGSGADYFLLSVSLDPEMEIQWLEAFYRGLLHRKNLILAGGETVRGDRFGLTITVLGEGGEPGTLMRRSSLRPGERLWVTGSLGRAYEAPEYLELAGGLEGDTLSPRSGGLTQDRLEQLRAFIAPRAELETGACLRGRGVRCAIDISDGLISEAKHLSNESKVNIILDIQRDIFFESVRDDPLEAAAAGEDFVLLFSAPQDDDFSDMGCRQVGYSEEGEGELTVLLEGKGTVVHAIGYDHLEVGE